MEEGSGVPWHPVLPEISDPDLAPPPGAKTLAAGAAGVAAAAAAAAATGDGFFYTHRFAIIIAIIILIVVLVVLYMYLTRQSSKKVGPDADADTGARPDPGASSEPRQPTPEEINLAELKRLRDMRRQAKGGAGEAPVAVAAVAPAPVAVAAAPVAVAAVAAAPVAVAAAPVVAAAAPTPVTAVAAPVAAAAAPVAAAVAPVVVAEPVAAAAAPVAAMLTATATDHACETLPDNIWMTDAEAAACRAGVEDVFGDHAEKVHPEDENEHIAALINSFADH